MHPRIIDINDRGLFAFCELRLYLPLDVRRKCYEWIKLIIWAKTSHNPRHVAPLNFIFITVFVSVFFFCTLPNLLHFFWHKSRSPRTPLITLRVNSFFYCLSSMFPPFIVSGRACMTISRSTLALARSG